MPGKLLSLHRFTILTGRSVFLRIQRQRECEALAVTQMTGQQMAKLRDLAGGERNRIIVRHVFEEFDRAHVRGIPVSIQGHALTCASPKALSIPAKAAKISPAWIPRISAETCGYNTDEARSKLIFSANLLSPAAHSGL